MLGGSGYRLAVHYDVNFRSWDVAVTPDVGAFWRKLQHHVAVVVIRHAECTFWNQLSEPRDGLAWDELPWNHIISREQKFVYNKICMSPHIP